jgi:hypothetical protein
MAIAAGNHACERLGCWFVLPSGRFRLPKPLLKPRRCFREGGPSPRASAPLVMRSAVMMNGRMRSSHRSATFIHATLSKCSSMPRKAVSFLVTEELAHENMCLSYLVAAAFLRHLFPGRSYFSLTFTNLVAVYASRLLHGGELFARHERMFNPEQPIRRSGQQQETPGPGCRRPRWKADCARGCPSRAGPHRTLQSCSLVPNRAHHL